MKTSFEKNLCSSASDTQQTYSHYVLTAVRVNPYYGFGSAWLTMLFSEMDKKMYGKKAI